jgi:kumamolisin
MAKVKLQGSERQPMLGAKAVGKADPNERLEVSVVLRRRNASKLTERVRKLAKRESAGGSLSREDFERQFGADTADIDAVKAFAAQHGLAIVEAHAGRRTVVLSGTVAQFNVAFDVNLQRFEHAGGTYRGREGSITLPDTLQGRVEAVLGLDNRPAAQPHFRTRLSPAKFAPLAGAAASTSFTPPQIAALYNFPPGTGQGQCVGIIELGGGERPLDLHTYFSSLGISPGPTVTVFSVDHAKNHPTGPNSADGEVMLDIEVVGAVAPQAKIAVYFAPNTDAGFLDAITTAVHDTTNKPSVISISWGGPESSWTAQSMAAFDSAFQAAAALGITVCAASGDSGSSDGVSGGGNHVDFPASSPHVLACGGTRIQASGTTLAGETVWNDGAQGGAGGGGVSATFALPAWQDNLQVTRTAGGTVPLTMRGVPDICGDADPESGYEVRVDRVNMVIGGTSAVAPLWAGLLARINAAKGSPVGFINPTLYANPTALRDITQGNNGAFAAAPGWDACTGLGSPDGVKVAAVLQGTPATS